METRATTAVPASNTPSINPTATEKSVQIKTEVIDPGYQHSFEATTTPAIIKSEREIKKEIKKEPMDASENDNHRTKMPLPILEKHEAKMPLHQQYPHVKRKQKQIAGKQTPSSRSHLRIVGIQKTKMKGKKRKTVIYEPASANNSGYYPSASAIRQRVPYLNRKWIHPSFRASIRHRGNYNKKFYNPQNLQQSNTAQRKRQSFHDKEQNSPSDDNLINENQSSNSSEQETSEKSYFFLYVGEFPKTWSEEQVKEFLEKEYGPVKQFEMLKDLDSNFLGDVQIEFETFKQREEAQKKLNGKTADGKTLSAEINDATSSSDNNSGSDSEYSEPSIKRTKLKIESAYRPDIDVWEKDPKGLYGLKPEYLQSLGITPPIDRWVQVKNFRCDKTELKEVLELAGQVLLCTVITINHKIAKVMYSHPLEAVQAVSMLNNQMFYGQSLKVTIERCLDRQIVLPKGLHAVGRGLGQNGITLRDIVRHYERFARGQSSSIDPNAFRELNFKMDSSDTKSKFSNLGFVQPKTEEKKDDSQSVGRFVPNPCNPTVNPNITMSGPSGPMAGSSGPMPGSSGPMPGSSGPMPGSSGPMPGSSIPRAGPSFPMHGPSVPMSRPSGHMPGIGGPMPGPNGPRPVNGGPIHNQIWPNVSGPMSYPTGPISNQTRPGFCPNPIQVQMMGQGTRIPRSTGPMPGPTGPMPGPTGLMPGPTGPMPGPTGPMSGQRGPMSGPMGPISGQFQIPKPPGSFPVQPQIPGLPGPMQNQPGRFQNQPQQGNISPGSMGPAGPNQVLPRPRNNAPAMTMNSASCPGPIPLSQENCTVEISNLPSNTTFTFLGEKLASCGRLMSLQLTPGRAVAQFATRGHAENCYKQFNKLKVYDNILQVKFI